MYSSSVVLVLAFSSWPCEQHPGPGVSCLDCQFTPSKAFALTPVYWCGITRRQDTPLVAETLSLTARPVYTQFTADQVKRPQVLGSAGPRGCMWPDFLHFVPVFGILLATGRD